LEADAVAGGWVERVFVVTAAEVLSECVSGHDGAQRADRLDSPPVRTSETSK
jgi:hypothetical protein